MTQNMPLEVITIESPFSSVLTTPAEFVMFPLTSENRALITAMKETLHQLGGVGLAAPQVKQNKRIISIYIPENAAKLRNHAKAYPLHVLINPKYEPAEGTEVVADFEGCYSVTNKAGKIPRFETINLCYYDESGTLHTAIESGFYARVLQHEIDHINGILITDRLTPDCLQGSVEDMQVQRRVEFSAEQKALYDELLTK